ncbi:MAG: SRPBCC family protein [Actinobacteria bacterium]|nr:SRPBCC family protein [Actinomycetota bacterium]
MEAIDLFINIGAPIERVWELLSDQEGYTFVRQVSKAELLEEGRGDRNGIGAVLKIRAMGATILWEVVGYEPPHRFEYRITRFPLPFRHETGSVQLTSRDSGTDVRWLSRFEVPIPLAGHMLELIIKRVIGKVHQSTLEQAKVILEA